MRIYLAPKVLVMDEFGISDPTTGTPPPLSSPWCQPGTDWEASS